MAVILHIETSTQVCSAALSENGKVIAYRETTDDKSHASKLTVFIEEILNEHKIPVDAVAVSKGPGSYTGLRIGVSTAKGIAYGSNIPLIAISTLQSMAISMRKQLEENRLSTIRNQWIKDNKLILCPMLDARRMEVYTALFDFNGNQISEITAEIIDKRSFIDTLTESPVLFFGNGAEKCKGIIESPNAVFISDKYPTAKGMIELAHKAYINNNFVDKAYFEPLYLKDFVAKVSKIKGLY